MDHGFFGMAFDFDHDGHLDDFERAADFSLFMSVMDENTRDELEAAGLSPAALDIMEDWERREALEDAGLDPDDYDF